MGSAKERGKDAEHQNIAVICIDGGGLQWDIDRHAKLDAEKESSGKWIRHIWYFADVCIVHCAPADTA